MFPAQIALHGDDALLEQGALAGLHGHEALWIAHGETDGPLAQVEPEKFHEHEAQRAARSVAAVLPQQVVPVGLYEPVVHWIAHGGAYALPEQAQPKKFPEHEAPLTAHGMADVHPPQGVPVG